MKAQTLADMSATAEALHRLLAEHGDLPAAVVRISPINPSLLDVSLHSARSHKSTDDFATWRRALGLPDEDVTKDSGGGSSWLTVEGTFGEARVQLTAFLPDDEQEES
ncbi:hypothetical protein [Streptomyces sp. URMC 124]|uniref:hypothetical protein n=1 Tax=Streptomyces sp. URMC 124 TaxID=3423405 RepID=UPI003F1CD741